MVHIISNLWVWKFGLEVIVATLRRSSLDNIKFKLLKQQKAQKELKLKCTVHGSKKEGQ
jgi:hypothetical protein